MVSSNHNLKPSNRKNQSTIGLISFSSCNSSSVSMVHPIGTDFLFTPSIGDGSISLFHYNVLVEINLHAGKFHNKNETTVTTSNPSRVVDTRSEAEFPMDCDLNRPEPTGARLTTSGCNSHRRKNRYWTPHQSFPYAMLLSLWGHHPTKNEGFCHPKKISAAKHRIDYKQETTRQLLRQA